MTAWELLIVHSTALPESSAWTHLNSQQGGGAGTVIIGGLRSVDKGFALSANAALSLTAQIKNLVLTADKPYALSAQSQQQLTAYLCQ